MWQQVDPTKPAQLQAAVAVLAAHDDRWMSPDQLKTWMARRQAQLFYLHDPSYDLLLGYRYLPASDRWRLVIGGARGTLGLAAAQAMSQQIVQFLQAQGVSTLEMYILDRAPGDPKRKLVDEAADVFRQNANVAEVTERPAKIGRRYEAVLK